MDLLTIVIADLVQLDNEVLEHEDCIVIGDESGGLVGLKVWVQVLAQEGLRVPAAWLFDLYKQVTEEVGLYGFPQVAGGVLGNPLAGLGKGNQLRLAGFVLFSFAAISRASSA